MCINVYIDGHLVKIDKLRIALNTGLTFSSPHLYWKISNYVIS